MEMYLRILAFWRTPPTGYAIFSLALQSMVFTSCREKRDLTNQPSKYYRVVIKTPALAITHPPNIWEILANIITPRGKTARRRRKKIGVFAVLQGENVKKWVKKSIPPAPKFGEFWQIL